MTEEEVLSKGADAPLTENPRTKPGLTYAAGGGQSPTPPITLGIPTCGLKESIRNLKILYRSTNGEICPRCEGTEFNKLGTYTYKGKSYPKKLCRNCGYTFSIIDLQKDGSTRNRAARIFNLDNKKADDLINDALQFGLIKRTDNEKYIVPTKKNASKSEPYHKIPLYRYLIESVGYNLKRCVFENALKSHPDKSLALTSKIKKDTLWRRYQEIAIEIFVCEKTCKFSRTCKKISLDRMGCSIVKKDKIKRRWVPDIEI